MLPVRTSWLLAVVASVLVITEPDFAAVSVPDWVLQKASAPVPALPPEVEAVWLLSQRDYTVTGPGEYIEHSRTVLKILRPDGREYGYLSLTCLKSEPIRLLHAWSIDPAGHQYEVKEKDFV